MAATHIKEYITPNEITQFKGHPPPASSSFTKKNFNLPNMPSYSIAESLLALTVDDHVPDDPWKNADFRIATGWAFDGPLPPRSTFKKGTQMSTHYDQVEAMRVKLMNVPSK